LFCARSLKVTDQRDIIYSSLGSKLALNDGNLMIRPDYKESLDDLHIRAAHALLLNPKEAPQVLARVIQESKKSFEEEDYPTWVPRWTTFSSIATHPIPLTWSYEHHWKPYRASRGSKTFEHLIKTDNILVVTGFIFDTINWTSLLLKVNNFPSHLNGFLAYCEFIRSRVGSETPSPFPLPGSSPAVVSNAEQVITRCRDRRVAYTEKKRLALVPLVAESGDVCCIVQGTDIPVILRRTSRDTYKLVGDSYIHGVMDGEMMSSADSGDFKWETIRLE
jgi:hypothetical protein